MSAGTPTKLPYLSSRTRNGVTLWKWQLSGGIAPSFRPRALECGTDFEAACAIATRMNERAGVGQGRGERRIGTKSRTAVAKQFAALDAASRQRELSADESVLLEECMRALGMLPKLVGGS